MTRRSMFLSTASLNLLGGESEFKPIHFFKRFRMLAISSSGKLILGAKNFASSNTYNLTSDGWEKSKAGQSTNLQGAVQILDPSSGALVLNCKGYHAVSGSFWAESETALIRCVEQDSSFFWAELGINQVNCRRLSESSISGYLDPTSDGKMLAYESAKDAKSGILKLYAKNGQILSTVQSVPEGISLKFPAGFLPEFSSDRRTFLHEAAQVVFFRSSENLSIRWHKSYNTDSWLWQNASFCPLDGGPVAILQKARGSISARPRSQVVIVDSSSGDELSTIPVDFCEHLAMSADAKRIAVATKRQTKSLWEEWDLIVKVYSTAEGKLLGELHHDRVPRHQGVMDTYWHGSALAYTRDNQFLISSGRNTKIWRRDLL
jgi:hypothetical protein